ncbi:MAG: RidA family protein [Bacteroidota bacterium]
MAINERLKELGIMIPEVAPRGVGNYAPWVNSQNIIYTSGQLPWKDGKYGELAYKGRVGSDLDVKQAYDCTRVCTLNAIAQLKQACGGDLDKVRKIIRIDCHIQAADGFKEHSDVLNGASDLVNEIFEDRGIHTRSALGIYQTPLDAPVLVYVIAEIDS